MKFSKLTRKLGDLLFAERRIQQQKRDKLKRLLKQMKEQQTAIKLELKESTNPEKRAGLELKLQILTEQRRKGIQLKRRLSSKKD